MATTKDRWITAQEAAVILTKNTDHEISPDYVRMLAKANKIDFRARDRRTNEYRLSDIEAYHVRPQKTPRVRPRPSTRRVQVGEKEEAEAEAVA
jgi:hypothetical protein